MFLIFNLILTERSHPAEAGAPGRTRRASLDRSHKKLRRVREQPRDRTLLLAEPAGPITIGDFLSLRVATSVFKGCSTRTAKTQ